MPGSPPRERPTPDPAERVKLSDEAREKLFGFDRAGWRAEFDSIGEYLREYGPRMPQALLDEQQRTRAALDR